MTRLTLFFSVLLLFFSSAKARVFSFGEETVAPYINFRGGLSSMGNSPFRWQSATSYSGDEIDLIYGGEFGLYLRAPAGFGVSFGILVDTFDPVEGAVASDASGNALYQVHVEGLSYGPMVLIDYQFAAESFYLWKFVFGGGYQFATIDATYALTATGESLVGGQSSLTESYKTEVPFAVLGIGTEFILSGSSTMSVLFGYHYALNASWTYGQGGQNFAGTRAQGDPLVFEDGSEKSLDWSYPFLQIGFQFYVDTVR